MDNWESERLTEETFTSGRFAYKNAFSLFLISVYPRFAANCPDPSVPTKTPETDAIAEIVNEPKLGDIALILLYLKLDPSW